MLMKKRGQATVFIILGIVLVIIVALYIVGTQTRIIPPLLGGGSAQEQMGEVDEHITECLENIGSQYVTQLALQGGYLSIPADSYKLYNDTQVSYLCYNQLNSPTCSNRMLTIPHMEQELEDTISSALETCINVQDYSSDLTGLGESWVLEVDILQSGVDLTLTYPVEITQDEQIITQEEFSYVIDAPLGELYDVTIDIVNSEASVGDFDQLIYMLQKFSKYTIYKYKPYPDKIYQVRLREGDFIFQFAIQGEELV
tara:strand:- start:10 stop:777 length:768 start_codon:yes stop_codon:yes gene_type:complete